MPENTLAKRPAIIRLISRFREPVNALTHLGGAILALIGMIWLIVMAWGDPGRITALAIFGTSMVLLYTASGVMHLYNGRESVLQRLNEIDHASIYLLIAGTYTPFCYGLLDGWWRIGMLITIWTLAGIGVILKLGFRMYGHISTVFYVLMGWTALIAVPQFIKTGVPGGAWSLIIAGGIIYTVGAFIFAIRKPNFHRHFGHHELWHIFVLVGSACHFIAIAIYVA